MDDADAKVKSVTITMNTADSLYDNAAIRSILNEDVTCTDVVGLIGEPFSITASCEFDSARISFEMSEAAIAETPREDMLVLWYDEANGKFEEMETTYDAAANTVSIETPHFSKYMVVDRTAWFNAWSMTFNYNPGREHQGSNYTNYQKNDTVLAIDCSSSMNGNDTLHTRTDINSQYDAQFPKICGRIEAGEKFVGQMMGEDRTGIVLFENSVTHTLPMTSDQLTVLLALQDVHSAGGTQFKPAIEAAMAMFSEEDLNDTTDNKRIILLSDGGDNGKAATRTFLSNIYNQNNNTDKRRNVKIFTVALGSRADHAFLEEIANQTGGVPYTAATASELVGIYSQIGLEDFDTTDTDGDGLYDAVESAGIRLNNGQIVYTDPTKKDTDGDGLEDGQEIDPRIRKARVCDAIEGYYFRHTSLPNRINSDNDYYEDRDDAEPLLDNTCFRLIASDGPDYEETAALYHRVGARPPSFYTEHLAVSRDEYLSQQWEDLGDFGIDFAWFYIAQLGAIYAATPTILNLPTNFTATGWSVLAGNKDAIAYGSTPNASLMLWWFVWGDGKKFTLNEDMFANLILSQEHNVEHYLKNLDACINEAEYLVNERNPKGLLECLPDARFSDAQEHPGMYISCFANRGRNCPYAHMQVSLGSSYACDWNLAVGESFGTLQADVRYLGNNQYSMDYTYYLYDVYEWPDIEGLRNLHLRGGAEQYPIYGEISGSITWTKGQRAYEGALEEKALLEVARQVSDITKFYQNIQFNSDHLIAVMNRIRDML